MKKRTLKLIASEDNRFSAENLGFISGSEMKVK